MQDQQILVVLISKIIADTKQVI